MKRRYLLIVLAVAGLVFSIFTVFHAWRIPPSAVAVILPPTMPPGIPGDSRRRADRGKAGEHPDRDRSWRASSSEVFVKRGDMVKKGEPLFRLDDRDLKAQLRVAKANLLAAQAQYDRLKAAPQQGDIPTSEAAVEEAGPLYRQPRWPTAGRRRFSSGTPKPRRIETTIAMPISPTRRPWIEMEADLRRLKVTWEKDKEVYRTAVMQARSQVESIQINLERLVVRARRW